MDSSTPPGRFTASDLIVGKNYRVFVAFKDYDGATHPVGEVWRFLRKNFVPYDDGLSLFVERDGREIALRLQWRPEAQGALIDGFSDFVQEA